MITLRVNERCPLCLEHFDDVAMQEEWYSAVSFMTCCNNIICTNCAAQYIESTGEPYPCPFCKTALDGEIFSLGFDRKQSKVVFMKGYSNQIWNVM